MEIDYEASAWFAGFADGEGCFMLRAKYQPIRRDKVIVTHKIVGIQPVFTLGPRADDVAVLRRLAAVFGGSVIFNTYRQQRNGKPRAIWTVASRPDLRRVVAYFETFPLQSKKSRDFEVWREAVGIYCARGHRAPELELLRTVLQEGRAYAVSEPVELRLVAGGN